MNRLAVVALVLVLLPGCGSAAKGRQGLAKKLLLDSQIIEKEEPGSLATKAQELVFSTLKDFKTDHTAVALTFPQQWRAVYTTTVTLEGEVNNGGLHQYFYNYGGQLNAATLEDLTYIGATEHHELFTQALVIYAKHNYVNERKQAGKNWDSFTQGYKEKRFEELDKAFYKLPQSLSDLLGTFIKKHPDLYTRVQAE